MRVHQWVKNILIFVPVALDHQTLNPAALSRAVLAFIAFSLAASAAYVLNDVVDAESDRLHPVKRHRPFAARTLSPRVGLMLVPVLLVTALVIAFGALPRLFGAMLALYVVLTTVYSLRLKQLAVVDVLLLAGLYTLRVLAGGVASGARFSTWLLAFSMFLFLSLAFLKRYGEVNRLAEHADGVARRGYVRADREWLGTMGGTTGYLSVLVLALYINSDDVRVLYAAPALLWLVCPILLYWISRMWLLAYRGQIAEDPILATVRDPMSYLAGALVAVVLMAAAWAPRGLLIG